MFFAYCTVVLLLYSSICVGQDCCLPCALQGLTGVEQESTLFSGTSLLHPRLPPPPPLSGRNKTAPTRAVLLYLYRDVWVGVFRVLACCLFSANQSVSQSVSKPAKLSKTVATKTDEKQEEKKTLQI